MISVIVTVVVAVVVPIVTARVDTVHHTENLSLDIECKDHMVKVTTRAAAAHPIIRLEQVSNSRSLPTLWNLSQGCCTSSPARPSGRDRDQASAGQREEEGRR